MGGRGEGGWDGLPMTFLTPEDRETRVSDADSDFNVTPACDMPYHTFRLDELFQFYEQNIN